MAIKKTEKINLIYQYLLQIICAEGSKIHDTLPTELEISSKFKISRPTVRKAIDLLVNDGLIYSKRGMGTFIKHKKLFKKERVSFGFVFPLIDRGEIFRPITEEIINLSERMNFSLILGGNFRKSENNIQQMDQMVDFYISNRVDGIILAPIERTSQCFFINKNAIEKVTKANIPLILVDGDYLVFPNRSQFDLVGIDNFRVSYQLVQHYIDQGAERVDYFSFAHSAQTIPLRIRGYQQALLDAGIMPLSNWIHHGNPDDVENVASIIKGGASNFICSNDDVAVRLIRALGNLNLSIPDQVRVIGFDNLEYAKYLHIPLTTASQPCKNLARAIISKLKERIQYPHMPAQEVLLEATLHIRQSSIIPTI